MRHKSGKCVCKNKQESNKATASPLYPSDPGDPPALLFCERQGLRCDREEVSHAVHKNADTNDLP